MKERTYLCTNYHENLISRIAHTDLYLSIYYFFFDCGCAYMYDNILTMNIIDKGISIYNFSTHIILFIG